MQPLDDDDLILYIYGESSDAEAIEAQEAQDPALRARLDALREMLGTVSRHQPPEPSAAFEARLWDRLAPAIGAKGRPSAPQVAPLSSPVPVGSIRDHRHARRRQIVQRTLALAAVLTLVIAAFLLGRLGRTPAEDEAITVASDRILLDAVSDHLSRSQMLFLALANADLDATSLDTDAAEANLETLRTDDLARAGSLLHDNRLYRQAASRIDRPQLAMVLDDLERILTEIANAPVDSDARHIEALRQRIEDQDLLFKVRVLTSTLEHLAQDRESTSGDPKSSGTEI